MMHFTLPAKHFRAVFFSATESLKPKQNTHIHSNNNNNNKAPTFCPVITPHAPRPALGSLF